MDLGMQSLFFFQKWCLPISEEEEHHPSPTLRAMYPRYGTNA